MAEFNEFHKTFLKALIESPTCTVKELQQWGWKIYDTNSKELPDDEYTTYQEIIIDKWKELTGVELDGDTWHDTMYEYDA